MHINSLLLNEILLTFRDSSTNLGRLFVVVGNTELSKKMAPFRTDQKCLVSKPVSLPAVLVLMWRDTSSKNCTATSRDALYRIFKQAEEEEMRVVNVGHHFVM
jgi:hypothetical protein